MTKRRKRKPIIHVTPFVSGWEVEIEWPFKVKGEALFSYVAVYDRLIHASNLADRLEGELQGAEIVIHD